MFEQVTLHMSQRRAALIWTLENQVLTVRCIQHKIPTRPNGYNFAIRVLYIVPVSEHRSDQRNPTNSSQRQAADEQEHNESGSNTWKNRWQKLRFTVFQNTPTSNCEILSATY